MGSVSTGQLWILAFDPGETTGWALLQAPVDVCAYGTIRGDRSEAAACALIAGFHPDEVVLEDFRIRPAKAHALGGARVAALAFIGTVEDWCRRHEVPCVLQAPSCKQFFAGRRLRLFVPPTGSAHADDAVRHAFYRAWFGHKFVEDERVRTYLAQAQVRW